MFLTGYFLGLLSIPLVVVLLIFAKWAFAKTEGIECVRCNNFSMNYERNDYAKDLQHYNISVFLAWKWHSLVCRKTKNIAKR